MTPQLPEHVSEYDRQIAQSLKAKAQEVQPPSQIELLMSMDRSLKAIKGWMIFFGVLTCIGILIGLVEAAAHL